MPRDVAGYLCDRCGRISHEPGGNCGHTDAAVPLCRASERDEALRVLMNLADEFSGMAVATDLSILERS
jgi:hypothetical protein